MEGLVNLAARPLDFTDLPAGDGVLALSPQGTVLAATLQAERLLQQRLEPGQTLQMQELFPEPHLSQIELALQDARQTGTSRSHIPVLMRPGSAPAVVRRCSVAPLYSQLRKIIGVLLTFHDDPRARASSARSNFGLGVEAEAVFEDLERGLFIVDQRRRITAFNRRAQEITGFPKEEAIGRHCWEVF